MFGNVFAARETILNMQANRILDVFYGFFVRISLAVTSLKRGAGHKVAVRVQIVFVNADFYTG